MSLNLYALSFDAKDPVALARFWGGVLRREVAEDDGVYLRAEGKAGFRVQFLQSDAVKDRPNQIHFDLTSQTPEEQQETVARALELGGRHLDIGQGPEITHVVLADPEGNEFCVIAAGNKFLANTATIGALSSDGTQAVGYFWSKALDWPLVWDQDEETAIQSPDGGSKISWGGPPVAPKPPKNRLHLDVAPPPDGNPETEAKRLITLGARRLPTRQHTPNAIPMADPDNNEFCVLTPR
ncbi:VOC family protein [Kribbella hippodromi]|uniref:VOC family protein n=1 Tax=Kribbella hippodromi TaxID=434347 RepID=A0ABP4Q6W1_9ACTN